METEEKSVVEAAKKEASAMPSELFQCNYPDEASEKSDSEFHFETDHEALRGNSDYLALLRTLSILQAQKVQAVRDVDALLEARDEALKDPLEFVAKLQRGEHLDLPKRQSLPEIPDINWDKYNLVSLQQLKPDTRHSRGDEKNSSYREQISGIPGAKVERNAQGQYLVRGRLYNPQMKPKTFNQPWTPEEQTRLEQLLIDYPSEDVEMERWKKIANALGNRTAIQVQSRVQKYFLKLYKAGLPIPGKLSKHSKLSRPVRRHGILKARNSTFFPHFKPSVVMTESEETSADDVHFYGTSATSLWSPTLGEQQLSSDHNSKDFYLEMDDVSDEEGVDEDTKRSPEYQELLWLKRIRREKEFVLREGGSHLHVGFKCDICNADPIKNGRFSCVECSTNGVSVDFCLDCAPKNREILSVGHTREHTLRAARKRQGQLTFPVDKDYVISQGNYLDPNFIK